MDESSAKPRVWTTLALSGTGTTNLTSAGGYDVFFAKYDENAIWLDDLKPISDEKFFFEEEMMEFQKNKLNWEFLP